ncbi:MAG: rod shape-determining protein MreD [Sedimentibacter sp.]
MKKNGIIAAIVVVNFIFQTSLYNFFGLFGTIPNISLILVVVFAMMSNGIVGGVIGIVTGILYDSMMYNVFGIYTLMYFLIGAVVGTYSKNMLRENYLAYCLVTAISTIVMHISLYLILFFLRYRVVNVSNIIGSIFLEIIYNTILVVFVLRFIDFIFDKLNIKQN